MEEEETNSKLTTGYCDSTEFTKFLGIVWDSSRNEFLFSFSGTYSICENASALQAIITQIYHQDL